MRLLAQRLVQMAVVLVLVATGTFFLLNLMPGDPAAAVLGEGATPEAIEQVRRDLGLADPVPERFVKWAADAVRGDLGVSYRDGESVTDAIRQRLPNSLQIMLMTQLLALAVAIPAALAAANRPGQRRDRALSGASFAMLATPEFVIALFLLIVFAKQLAWLPAADFVPFIDDPVGNLRALVLPVVSLAVPLTGVYFRVLRNDLVQTMASDHITRARASGLTERQIMVNHAFRSSSLTLLAVVGLNTAALLGGVVVVEQIYSIPGLGRFLLESAVTRDYIKVQGAVLVVAVTFVTATFLVDVVLQAVDPRVRAGAGKTRP
jgi:peptide/nickel transport system permease protein